MNADEMRDIGPYEDTTQALTQFENWSRGMDGVLPLPAAVTILLTESLMLAGVKASDYERQVLRTRGMDPELAQVISGWLIRAAISERDRVEDAS